MSEAAVASDASGPSSSGAMYSAVPGERDSDVLCVCVTSLEMSKSVMIGCVSLRIRMFSGLSKLSKEKLEELVRNLRT